MAPEDKDHFLDRVLDKALEEFGNTEPRAGLENRVLTNLRMERKRRATKHAWWAVGSVVAAAAVIAAVWLGNAPSLPKVSVKIRPESKKSEEVGALKVEQVVRPKRPGRTRNTKVRRQERLLTSRTGAATLPRLGGFPSPRPLSDQEKLLLAYVTRAPKSEINATLARAKDASDLQITDLEISPLSGPETHEGNDTQ